MRGKKSKKSFKSFTNISLGIPTNLAVGPLGFRAALEINPKEGGDEASRIVVSESGSEAKGHPVPRISTAVVINDVERGDPPTDEDNHRPSRIVPCEREGDVQEVHVTVTSTTAAVHHIERVDHPTGGNVGHAMQEDEPAMELEVPEQDHRSATLGASITRTDVERASGFGPLKTLLQAISAVYANCEGFSIAKKVEGLISRVASMDALFAIPPGDVAELRLREEVIRELKGIGGKLRSLYEQSGSKWLIDHTQHDEGVFNLLEDLREAIFHYQMVQRTRIDDQAFQSVDPAGSDPLNELCYARKAEYQHGNRNRCLQGTRVAVLGEIELWTRDFHEPPVYRLNGLAGTGKSTVAQTIAERIFADGQLGASFFCSRDFEDRRNLEIIFPTIATQLARRYHGFRAILVPLVRSDPEVAHETLYGQMDN